MSFDASSSNPTDCFTAQTTLNVLGNGLMNPDVGGFAVSVANIIINICLTILFKWSEPDNARTSVYGLFLQVYPILLATIASIYRTSTKLTLFEAHFSVAVCASPISVYLAYNAIYNLYQHPGRFRHLMTDTGNTAARWLALLLPFLWLAVNIIVSFSDTAFKNSHLCRGMTVGRWLGFQIVSNFVGVLDVMGMRDLWDDLHNRGGLGAVSVCALWAWGVYFVRHRIEIWNLYHERRRDDLGSAFYARWPRNTQKFVKASWDVVAISHPWLILVIICCLHWSWILGISKAISVRNYDLTYGQALCAFSVIPSLVAVVKLICVRQDDFQTFLYNLPIAASEETRFFLTGQPNPWPRWIGHPHLPNLPSHSTPKTPTRCPWSLSMIVVVTSLIASGLHAAYIVNYVIAGSIPNPRTIVNNPHQNWKPFSVGGYLVGCINILVWTTYLTRTSEWLSRLPAHTSTPSLLRRFLKIVNLTIILPVGVFMCVSPLFSPFAALPLAEQWQWLHHCDMYQGEAILEGLSYANEPSLLTLYYAQQGTAESNQYQYSMSLEQDNSAIWTLGLIGNPAQFAAPTNSSFFVQSVTYDLDRSVLSATCTTTDNSSSSDIIGCLRGSFDLDAFTFHLNDTRVNTETTLRPTDREWMYSNDAPSFTLHYVQKDSQLGNVVMQSAVTKRNHCELLKICLQVPAPTLDVIVPLGLALWAEDHYATYCNTPRLYTY